MRKMTVPGRGLSCNRWIVLWTFVGLVTLFAVAASARSYALRGTVVTPDTVIDDGIVLVTDGRISAVGANLVVPTGVPTIDTQAVIFPGLIDIHNHITWNAFPRWTPTPTVTARYDWLTMPAYTAALDKPHGVVQSEHACDLERYGEVKAIMGGATSITGSLGPAPGQPLSNECIKGLARNLDFASGLNGDAINEEPLLYKVFPLELTPAERDSVTRALGNGMPVIVHLSEGITPSTAREFRMITRQGLLQPGLTIIHGVALGTDEFKAMAANHVGMVWSPRSNIELYGQTAKVGLAKSANVLMAISPDWSPSGSNGMLDELRYAAAWNARQTAPVFTAAELVRMATINPATLAGVSAQLGSIAPGKRADLLLLQKQRGVAPHDLLLATRPSEVRLVIIEGRPIYGDAQLLNQVNPDAHAEQFPICPGVMRAFDMSDSDAGRGGSVTGTLKTLGDAFQRLVPSIEVAPLVDCARQASP
jgi:cytosine/adenosine deaminase-related metal-dependent hydrolase